MAEITVLPWLSRLKTGDTVFCDKGGCGSERRGVHLIVKSVGRKYVFAGNQKFDISTGREVSSVGWAATLIESEAVWQEMIQRATLVSKLRNRLEDKLDRNVTSEHILQAAALLQIEL